MKTPLPAWWKRPERVSFEVSMFPHIFLTRSPCSPYSVVRYQKNKRFFHCLLPSLPPSLHPSHPRLFPFLSHPPTPPSLWGLEIIQQQFHLYCALQFLEATHTQKRWKKSPWIQTLGQIIKEQKLKLVIKSPQKSQQQRQSVPLYKYNNCWIYTSDFQNLFFIFWKCLFFWLYCIILLW